MPRYTVRYRLAALYVALFLASGAVLLVVTNVLVRRATSDVVYIEFARQSPSAATGTLRHHPVPASVRNLLSTPRVEPTATPVSSTSSWSRSAVGFVLMAAVAVGLGWFVAGRVLRRLHTITQAARDISAHDLHRRLALAGPRDELIGVWVTPWTAC